MGGFGVWALATEYPDLFAAAAPICRGGRPLLDFPERLRRIVALPVWAFHGAEDEEIPVHETRKLVEALKGYGGDVRCTVYPGVGHDSWTQAYGDLQMSGCALARSEVLALATGRLGHGVRTATSRSPRR